MQGENKIGQRNDEQYNWIQEIITQLELKDENPKDYPGVCYMLDGPGGNGKTFCLETLYAYCCKDDNKYLCLCSAFSGTHFI